jgi:hypothetical protein
MAESKERRKSPRKSAATPKPDNSMEVSSLEETRRLIAEAAYFRAKQRGFAPGHELEDWIQAESEVMGRIDAEPRPRPGDAR